MKKWLFALAVLAAGAATPAFAAAGGDENIFSGNLGNAVWTLIIFGVVLFILGKYAWGPLLEGLQQREQFIHDSLAEAKKDREDAEVRLEQYSAKLDEARSEATAIVEEGRRDAEVVKARIEEEAREESQRILDRAKREIDLAKQTAIKALYTSSAELATDIASRILQKELSATEREALVARSLDELEQADTN
ncbi:MAG: F0F1 ATP synthase subunit B [Thermoanaerobaculia bacterium]